MIYDLSEELLMLNSSLKSSYPIYSRIFGKLLFDDPSTLDLQSLQRSHHCRSLARMLCPQASSMPSKRSFCSITASGWRDHSIATSSTERMISSRDLKWRGGFFSGGRSAGSCQLRIKYRHVKARRNLTLYTGNSSSYTRDEYARHIEDWLQLRRFVMKTGARAAKGVSKDDQAVASY